MRSCACLLFFVSLQPMHFITPFDIASRAVSFDVTAIVDCVQPFLQNYRNRRKNSVVHRYRYRGRHDHQYRNLVSAVKIG